MTLAARTALALFAGAVCAASQPSLSLWPLAWFGLVPLFVASYGGPPRRSFFLGWACGLAYFALVLYWIAPTITTYTRITSPVAVVLLLMLAAVAALSFGTVTALAEWLAAAGVSRVVSLPAAWVVVDWSRTFFPAAFPWGFLGYSQTAASLAVQHADLAGVYGVTAVLVFTNAALTELWRDGVSKHRALAVAALLLAASVPAYSALRLAALGSAGPDGTVRVGVAQADIAQEEKWRPGLGEEIVRRYLDLSAKAVADGADIVLWPEASVPFVLSLDRRQRWITDFTAESGVPLLVGAPGYESRDGGEPRQYNQAWLVRPDGTLAGPYDKIRLVPFGEYVPFGPLLSWVDKAVEGVGDFGFGERHVIFEGPAVARPDGGTAPVRAAALICYESIFAGLTRAFVADGAELLVNLSNDAWYGRTAAPHQLLGMTAMRAIENRVPVVRSTNTGISAVIDASGAVRHRTPLFEEAWFAADVPLVKGFSPYAVTGDVFVYACIALLCALVAIRLRVGDVLIPIRLRGMNTG